MKQITQHVRGMYDVLPTEVLLWQKIRTILENILLSYGYKEIRLPIIEKIDLFKRIADTTNDIIEKEMYILTDRKGVKLTLRPEGTAGCVRSIIQNGLINNKKQQRFWYFGPMFRYERPQKGRYREFCQLGIEVFGLSTPYIEVELILLTKRLWNILGIDKYLFLEINSIGSIKEREIYIKELTRFFISKKSSINKEDYQRIYSNPIRILDSKDPNIKILLNEAPILMNYINDNSRQHFKKVCNLLNIAKIKYKINPFLVRGLDYYDYTVFEWITNCLGSQGTLCGGGRYNGLIQKLSNKFIPAIGCGIGIERLILLINTVNPSFNTPYNIDIFFIIVGETMLVKNTAFLLGEELRDEIPNIVLITDYNSYNLKKQLSKANKHNARLAIIFKKEELEKNKIIIKILNEHSQQILDKCQIIPWIKSFFNSINLK